jgi:uracil-DNA glycosylase
MSEESSKGLLLEIARCPNVLVCFENPEEQHPCSNIVSSQRATGLGDFQVPEPWNGLIGQAPLLFISSNPSYNRKEDFPLWSWDDKSIEDYFHHRFWGGRRLWVKNGVQGLLRNGTYSEPTPFWEAVKQRAIELFERSVQPGEDYALTEVVHCKSRRQKGVDDALEECSQRYLRRVIEMSGARVICILGAIARGATKGLFDIPADVHLTSPIEVGDKQRIFVFLPHPNAKEYFPKTFSNNYSSDELKRIRSHLRQSSV